MQQFFSRKEMTKRDQKSYLLPNPPSHILSNGHFAYLPEPTKQEKALFFKQSIVVHNIVSAQKLGGAAVGDDEEQVDAEEGDVRKKSSLQSEVKIHPLAIAAARIESLGISQLSKSINLGNLIGTEYFDMANIVSPEGILPTAIPAKNKSASDDSEARKKASVGRDRDDTYGKSDFTAQQLLDQRFRAIFLLKRKYSQLVDAAEFLGLHKRRLEGSLDRQRLIDRRYLQLRKQWRLAAPEHGTRVLGPVRSNEVIAVDVETYDRDRLGSKNQLPNEARRRLARLVPRYVTIELEPRTENVKEVESSTNLTSENCDSLKQSEVQPMDVDVKEEVPNISLLSRNDIDQNKPSVAQCNGKIDTASKSQLVTALSEKLNLITKAEPYAVADPTLGKLDLDFNPDKVPIWTLQLSLMKNSTGFSVSSTLSPVASLHTVDGVTSFEKQKEERGKVKMEKPVNAAYADLRSAQKDEKVIQSLQHSLFCASIFDAIRNEIRTANSSGSSSGSGRPTVWLSSETEEMFFPPTLLMVNSPGQPCREGKLGFCVSYCQEGEVAVQLDPEYVLTIKLIEVGTATEAPKMQDKLRNKNNGGMIQRDNIDFNNAHDSGSQTPEQLYTLCRALLLHVQFLYHDFRRKSPCMNKESSLSTSRLSATNVCARILEKCVAFGSKVLFEKKVMSVLNVRPSFVLLIPLFFFVFFLNLLLYGDQFSVFFFLIEYIILVRERPS
jgi:hypothetical protein